MITGTENYQWTHSIILMHLKVLRAEFIASNTMLTEQQVTKYQELYKKRFGKEISRDVALEDGLKLIRIMQLTYRPIRKNETENISNQCV